MKTFALFLLAGAISATDDYGQLWDQYRHARGGVGDDLGLNPWAN